MSNFYTLKGYRLKNNDKITESMEDYLEMIYRYNQNNLQIKTLASQLNVRPSSASKMINKLKDLDFVYFKKYGKINLTSKGKEIGEYLLWRHNVLVSFFKSLNKENYKLELVEKIEHFIDYKTLKNIESLQKILD